MRRWEGVGDEQSARIEAVITIEPGSLALAIRTLATPSLWSTSGQSYSDSRHLWDSFPCPVMTGYCVLSCTGREEQRSENNIGRKIPTQPNRVLGDRPHRVVSVVGPQGP